VIPPLPPHRRVWMLAALLALGMLGPRAAVAQLVSSRQVTLFGILATPDDPTVDPKLKQIAPQLRRVFPNHGFKLLGVETRRVAQGQTLVTDLGDGLEAGAQLLNPLDDNGKVQLRFELDQQGQIDFATIVNTPLNQLFFLDKRRPDGSKLIIGIGVRE
jgi:hypothetical protein